MGTARLALAVVVIGCSAPKPAPIAQTSTDSEQNQAMLRKLQGYIECLTEHSVRVFQIAGRYAERAGNAPVTVGVPAVAETLKDPAPCQKAIAAARALPPGMPALESAGDAFATALGRVLRLTTAARACTEGNTGGDTRAPCDPAGGPELVAAFHDFDAAQAALFERVARENRAVHLDQVARRERRDGRTLAIRSEHVMITAEDLVRFAATPWNHLERLDLAAFTPLLDALDRDIVDLAALAAAHPETVASVGGYWSYVDDARAYLVAGKQLAARARDRVAYTDAENILVAVGNEAAVAGTPAALARGYDRLVGDFARQQ